MIHDVLFVLVFICYIRNQSKYRNIVQLYGLNNCKLTVPIRPMSPDSYQMMVMVFTVLFCDFKVKIIVIASFEYGI